jgi:hypothetical protein
LLRRYAKLGGTKKFVAPPPPAETAAAPDATQPEASGDDATGTAGALPPVEIQPYKQGNESNPYCRFCP